MYVCMYYVCTYILYHICDIDNSFDAVCDQTAVLLVIV